MKKNFFEISYNEAELKRLDNLTIEVINWINILIVKCEKEKLHTIARILENTRENIAIWAAYEDYIERKD